MTTVIPCFWLPNTALPPLSTPLHSGGEEKSSLYQQKIFFFLPYVRLTSSSGSQRVTLVNVHSTAWWDFLPVPWVAGSKSRRASKDNQDPSSMPGTMVLLWTSRSWCFLFTQTCSGTKTMALFWGMEWVNPDLYILWNKSFIDERKKERKKKRFCQGGCEFSILTFGQE